MSGLLDFLQQASRSAGQSVTGLVDLASMALRPLGYTVPAEQVVGSTKWAERKGLLAPESYTPAGIAGQTVGGLLAPLASAKAPQIAAAANKAIDNAMVPSRLNPQLGAIVWHGSPHKFERFDAGKIGSGEGSQAYGYGHYVAESPDVARPYSVMAQKPARRQFGVTTDGSSQAVLDSLIKLNAKKFTDGNVSELVNLIQKRPGAFSDPEKMIARASEYVDNLPPAYVYKIDLPDEHIARMIDLEKAVPESVRDPLSKKALNKFDSGISMGSGESLLKQLEWKFKNAGSKRPAADAANWLKEQGIPGLRFTDAGSRSAPNGGTSNFVVFPGNEDLLKILEINGRGLLD